MKPLTLAFVLLLSGLSLSAQTIRDLVIPIRINQVGGTGKIRLSWEPVNSTTEHIISRKEPGEWVWKELATVSAGDSSYIDLSSQSGVIYEYMIRRQVSGRTHYGFVCSGLDIPAVHYRGEVFLVCDSGLYTRQEQAVRNYAQMLVGDGYRIRLFIPGTAWNHFRIKDSIKIWYLENPGRHKTLLLLGNIPVPYSGNINPDAHPEHKGAWPADVFYGEFHGDWSDFITANTAQRPENQNNPGDGKLDLSTIPDEVDLFIGRINFENLPVFGVSTDSLYLRYFEKSRQYRFQEVTTPRRILVDDLLGMLGNEAPGRNGYAIGWSLLGKDSTFTSDNAYVSTLTNQRYLLSHASAYGSYTGNGQVQSSQFTQPFYAVFQTFFGSYHGDWDNENNLLRSAIAGPGTTLTSIWAGRPQIHCHTLSLGYPIGHCIWLSQNNFIDQFHETYDPGAFAGQVHVALHGDPTLRLHTVKAPSQLLISSNTDKTRATLSWQVSEDPDVLGYHVYRSDSVFGSFNLLSDFPVTTSTFTDLNPLPGNNVYMVRTVKLEKNTQGYYRNMSQGIFSGIEGMNGTGTIQNLQTENDQKLNIYPNPAKQAFYIDLGQSGQLTVRNFLGAEILQTAFPGNAHIRTDNWTPGVYLIEISSPGKIYQQKVLVQD